MAQGTSSSTAVLALMGGLLIRSLPWHMPAQTLRKLANKATPTMALVHRWRQHRLFGPIMWHNSSEDNAPVVEPSYIDWGKVQPLLMQTLSLSPSPTDELDSWQLKKAQTRSQIAWCFRHVIYGRPRAFWGLCKMFLPSINVINENSVSTSSTQLTAMTSSPYPARYIYACIVFPPHPAPQRQTH